MTTEQDKAVFKPEEFWIRTEKQLPEERVVVRAMDSSGAIHTLKRINNLWFVPDGSMYVYFTPQFWQPISETPITAALD